MTRLVWWHLEWTRCPVCGAEVLSWWDEARGERVCVSHECRAAVAAA